MGLPVPDESVMISRSHLVCRMVTMALCRLDVIKVGNLCISYNVIVHIYNFCCDSPHNFIQDGFDSF